MRKSISLIKRVAALFLVLLLSIESFAAIVSDNDGSAFITKAEFDSLRNDFQSQIDQYNTSIDQKIDGAIASYLSGIKLTRTEELTLPTKQNIFKTLDDVNFTGRGTDVLTYDIVAMVVNTYSNELLRRIGFGLKWNVTYNPKNNYNVALAHAEGDDNRNAIWRGWAENYKKTYKACKLVYGVSGYIETIANRIGAVEILGPGPGSLPLQAEPLDRNNYYGYIGIYSLDTINAGPNWINYTINFGNSSYYTDNYGSVVNTYDNITDKLVLVSDYAMPFVFENDDITWLAVWDSKHVSATEWQNLGHAITGGGFRSKALNDTAAYELPIPSWADITTSLNTTTKSIGSYYLYNKHAHSEHTANYTTQNKKPITDQYGDSLIEKIRAKFPSYIVTTEKDNPIDGHPKNQGGSFYNLRGGLVLTDVPNDGVLSVTATNPTSNNIYLWVSDKPIEHNGVGLVTDKSKGAAWNNAVQINAGQTEKISFDVKKGDIIFFRFGRVDSTTSYTTRSGGQVQIDKIVLERE